jgi:hypothetical protein
MNNNKNEPTASKEDSLTERYYQAAAKFAHAASAMRLGKTTDFEERFLDWEELEKAYSIAGYRTVALSDFINHCGMANLTFSPINNLLSIRRSPTERPILHAAQFRREWLGKATEFFSSVLNAERISQLENERASQNASALEKAVDPYWKGRMGHPFIDKCSRLADKGSPHLEQEQIVKVEEQTEIGEGWVEGGWLVLGSIKRVLQQIAFSSGVSINTSVSICLAGRRVDFVIRGTKSDIQQFNRLLESTVKNHSV